MKIINPFDLKNQDFPLVVLVDDMRSLFPWIIKTHTHGFYNHAMMMVRPGYFATQGWTYKEVPVERYMKPQFRLKFWQCYSLSAEDRKKIYIEVMKDLKEPWYKKIYDPIGIIGQALNIRWINSPFHYYCSERVSKYLRMVGFDLPLHPSPKDLNSLFKAMYNKMRVLGYWMMEV